MPMRTKNHHLLKRGRRWYLRYDIPKRVAHCYSERRSRTIYEALHITDEVLARSLRDKRLRELEREWLLLGQQGRAQFRPSRAQSDATSSEVEPRTREALLDRLREEGQEEALSYLDVPLSDASQEDVGYAQERFAATERGRELLRRIEVAQGRQTPLGPLCDEWLASKNPTASVMYDYRKALALLCERFSTIEEVDHLAARRFLAELLKTLNRSTVQKYTTAYRGVWGLKGLRTDQWPLRGLDSFVQSTQRATWSDDEYLRLLKGAAEKGNRQLWLAIRIAAYTGAAAQGVSGVELVEDKRDRVSIYLPETKQRRRARLIPCHETIVEDVREWEACRLAPQPLSKRFGRLKTDLGFGREKVLHGFRHSVVNRLERAQVRGVVIKRLVGHKLNDITFDTYSADGPGYDVLREAVSAVRWPAPPAWR